MAKPSKECQTKINLEDLLRLKRSECPSDQFWNQFDRELHQRMLQTLVKKDPWYLQIMRGFSGRVLPSTALAVVVVIVAMVSVSSIFQSKPQKTISVAESPLPGGGSAPAEVASSIGIPYYSTDAISMDGVLEDADLIREFGMESIQVASYDASVYSADTPQARVSFASTGVISLVY